MRLQTTFALVSCIAALSAAPAMGSTVSVSFADGRPYADAGTSPWNEEASLQALAAHLQALGLRYLPAEQTLTVEVLDVDRVGTARPSRRGATLLRVVRDRADGPHIHLRYTLEAPGQAARTGDEWLSDIGYRRGLTDLGAADPLVYEKRMLESWFKARFAEHQAAAD